MASAARRPQRYGVWREPPDGDGIQAFDVFAERLALGKQTATTLIHRFAQQHVLADRHVVLEQPMDEDDRLARQFLELPHRLDGDLADMHERLECQPVDVRARIAGTVATRFADAARQPANASKNAATCPTAPRTAAAASAPTSEYSRTASPSSLLTMSGWARAIEDGLQELGDDGFRMDQADGAVPDKARVPADVGDDQDGD